MQHILNGIALWPIQIEVVSDMALGDHQRMKWGHREPIPNGEAEFVLCNDPPITNVTEDTANLSFLV
jgi:hypothetical protein